MILDLARGTLCRAWLWLAWLGVVALAAPPSLAQAPVITSPPLTRLLTAGQPATFTVAASGTGLSYQWKHNNQPIPGATAASYPIASVALADRGFYHVVVSNGSGSVSSVFRVNVAPESSQVINWDRAGRSVLLPGYEDVGVLAMSYAIVGLKKNGALVGGPPNATTPTVNDGVAISTSGSVAMVLLADGTFFSWGSRNWSSGAEGIDQVVDIAVDDANYLVLKADGSVIARGNNQYGQSVVPADLGPCVAVATLNRCSFALRVDGTVRAWGNNEFGQLTIFEGISNVVDFSVVGGFAVLKGDGTALGWNGGVGPPSSLPGVNNAVQVFGGNPSNVALKADGTVVSWGSQPAPVPTVLGQVFQIGVFIDQYYSVSSLPNPSVPQIAPLSRSVDVGATVTFSAVAVGSEPMTRRWQHDGVDLVDGGRVSGSSTHTLTITGVQVSDAGAYRMVATNSNGSGASSAVALTVKVPPSITTQPVAQSLNVNGTLSLTVAVTGPGPYAYQWRKNGTPLTDGGNVTGSQTAALTISNSQPSDAGTYSVVVSNAASSVTSADTSVKVLTTADFTKRPFSQIVALNQPVTFTTAVMGPGPITLQWVRNGRAIAGATGTTYTISSMSWADRGLYEVLATNSYGTVRSIFTLDAAAAVPVQRAVVGWPLNSSAALAGAIGSFVSLSSVCALRSDGSIYDWGIHYDPNFTPPPGVVMLAGSDREVEAVQADGTLLYWAYFANPTIYAEIGLVKGLALGKNHSTYLKLDGTVYDRWLSPPAGLSDVIAVAAGDSSALALKADGTVVAWGDYLEGMPANLANVAAIAMGTQHYLVLKADGTVVAWGQNFYGQCTVPAGLSGVVSISGGKDYSMARKADGSVVVWGGSVTGVTPVPVGVSGAMAVTGTETTAFAIVPAATPVITVPPVATVRNLGDTFSLTVTATGAPSPTYQWKKNGVALVDDAKVSGSKTATLTLSDGQKSDNGSYTVVVTNGVGSVESPAARVSLVTPPVIVSNPVIRTRLVGQSISFVVTTTDAPAVGFQWFHNGQAIPGAITAVLQLPSLTLADRGWYEVRATDQTGVTSRAGFPLVVEATDGVLVGWGSGAVSNAPPFSGAMTAIAAGSSHMLALKLDRTVVAWGSGSASGLPAGLANVVAISAGVNQSLALKADGTVIGWGGGTDGTIGPPILSDIVAVAAGGLHGLALKSDGTLVSWGRGAVASVPTGLKNVVAIAAAESHSIALKSDGSVVTWPDYLVVPPAARRDVVSISTSRTGYAVVKIDGTLVSWGADFESVGNPPALTNATSVAIGYNYGLVLKSDGGVVGWGPRLSAIYRLPEELNAVTAIAAGEGFAYALSAPRPPMIVTQPASRAVAAGDTVSFSVAATGSAPFYYEWYQDGAPLFNGGISNISGASTATLTLTNVGPADVGQYTVAVYNNYGRVTSAAATLSGPPTIEGVSTVAGRAFSLTVPSPGSGASTVQWRRNGTPIPGATGSSLAFDSVSRGDAGNYDYVLVNGSTVTASPATRLQVAPTSYPGKITFDPNVNVAAEVIGGWVYTSVVASNGKLYVGGDFSSVNGKLRNRVARFNADGTLDDTFVPPMLNGAVWAIQPLANGKVWVGGEFTSLRSATQNYSFLARLNADGSLDDSFTSDNPTRYVRTLAVQSDGKLLVGGAFGGVASNPNRAFLLRVNPNGTVDNTFGAGLAAVGGGIYSIAVDPSDRIIIGGSFGYFWTGGSQLGIARLGRDGALDASFAPRSGTNNTVVKVVLQGDGKLLLGGAFTNVNNFTSGGVARLLSDGTLDPGFSLDGSGFDSVVYAMDVQRDGKILVGGSFSHLSGSTVPTVVRLNSSGSRDMGFTAAPNNTVASLAVQSDGGFILTGYFLGVGNNTRFQVARIKADDTLDSMFTPVVLFPGVVNALLPLPGGKVLVGGDFDTLGGYIVPRNIGRLNADLSVDTAFNTVISGANGVITQLAPVGDGRVWVAGNFSTFLGVARGKTARLNTDGTLDTTFVPGTGPNVAPTAIAAMPGARLAVGGKFTSFDGASGPKRMVVLKSDGTQDTAFNNLTNVASDDDVRSLRVQADGKLLMGKMSGYTSSLTRFQADGSVDAAFTYSTITGELVTHAFEASGTLLIGGINILSRLNATGGANASFVGPYECAMQELLPLENGRALVRGQIDSFTGVSSTNPNSTYITRVTARGRRDDSFSMMGLVGVPTAFTLLDSGQLLISGGGTPNGLSVTMALAAPSVTTAPASFAGAVGSSTTLSVTVSGPGPFTYQWTKNGVDIPDKNSATLTLTNLQPGDSGVYAVTVTNAYGSISSTSATVVVQAPLAITTQPVSQAVWAGATASFSVTATGTPPLAYQWKKDGTPVDGATTATFTRTSAQATDAGKYTVVVTSGSNSITSAEASLSILPTGVTAAHAVVGAGYEAGRTVMVTNTLSLDAAKAGLRWAVVLPAGWSFASSAGGEGAVKPVAGATSLIEWEWTNLTAGVVAFSYVLNVPASAAGDQSLVAMVTINPGASAASFLVQPDPLKVSFRHAADVDHDGRISLFELTRVIEIYNTRSGTTRTGRYAIQVGSEDGFAPDLTPVGSGVIALPRYHTADTNRDGLIGLTELTRVIELYNTRSGTTRTGAYRVQSSSEDGFAPAP